MHVNNRPEAKSDPKRDSVATALLHLRKEAGVIKLELREDIVVCRICKMPVFLKNLHYAGIVFYDTLDVEASKIRRGCALSL